MTADDARALFRHMQWADASIWNAVQSTKGGLTDDGLKARLHHVHLVQRVYLQIWQGEPHEVRELSSFSSLADLHAWARDYYARLTAFAGSLESSAMEHPLAFPWSNDLVKWFGEARPATLQETIQQVALHTTHHRGQLLTTIRELGGTPPLVDFIAWVWMGKPDPAWQPITTESTRAPDA